MSKIYEVLDLELFETSQLKLNKSPAENMLRLVKELSDKNLLVIFDNCQNIMASEDRESFKKLTENLMKTCKDLVFIFTNRHSIGRQIDYCSEVLYELGKLTIAQAKTLFFNRVSRSINKQ
jgi:succinate dehydrogenase/fumarate reductase flavoprotein subunit